MFRSLSCQKFARFRFLLTIYALALVFWAPLSAAAQTNTTQRTPSDVVRDFYKALRERRFRDAWALTIYKPAVEGLTAEEMEDLLPTFEEKAAEVPEQVELSGEQISGNIATVFVKVPEGTESPQIISKPVTLIRSGETWIIGDEANQEIVKKAGKRFFLDGLIDSNQDAIGALMKRLIGIEIAYSQQHDGVFGNLAALIKAGFMSPDLTGTDSTGYHFHIIVANDGKGYVAGAEPARYGRTGKVSFWMDQTGNIKKADNGGKPLTAPK